jgi:rare lipoprotein A (peptidoglycan hydrolase)
MFTSAILFAALASSVIAAPVEIRGEGKPAPAHWAHGYLENYAVYHSRYLALDCYKQHNTTFFQDCCRPMLATETLEKDRLPYCTPNATATESVASYIATASAVTASADADAASAFISAKASATAASTTEAASASIAAQAQWAEQSSAEPTTTSTSEWVAPTSEYVAPTSTYEAPKETQAPANNDEKTGGHATYFYQAGNPGACGQYHSDSDRIVAIDSNGYWGNNFGSGSSYCGRWVTITNTNNGRTTTAMIADVCPTCVSDNSLDLSVAAFTDIASESDGMVPISWHFN